MCTLQEVLRYLVFSGGLVGTTIYVVQTETEKASAMRPFNISRVDCGVCIGRSHGNISQEERIVGDGQKLSRGFRDDKNMCAVVCEFVGERTPRRTYSTVGVEESGLR